MTAPLDAVLAAGGAGWEAAAVTACERSSRLRLVRRCVDLADLLAVAGTGQASVALVATSMPGLDLDVVDRLRRGGFTVVAVEGDPDVAARLGLGAPVAVTALDTLVLTESLPPVASSTGVLIAVWGPTGAPGRSSIALSLAAALAAQGTDTVLVDADVEGGAQAQALGVLDEVSGLVAACRAASRGVTDDVLSLAATVEPSLRLLSGLPRADMAAQVRPAAYDAVLSALLADAEVVVVDCGFGLDPDAGSRYAVSIATIDRADEIVVVGRAEPLGLTRLVRALHDLATVAPDRSPRVLLNQTRRTLGWSDREVDATVARLTGVTPSAHLPFDQGAWDAAAIHGRTPRVAAPSSPFVQRVEAFAAQLRVGERVRT